MLKVPKFILISDIHFSLQTLELASTALTEAFETARKLNIPLIIAGDLNDSKAIIRGEVANRLIRIFQEYRMVRSYTIIGNHDLLNEKGFENSLHFLKPYTLLVETMAYLEDLDIYLLPYQNNKEELEKALSILPLYTTVIMHQGFNGAWMGDYIQDRTSISVDLVKRFSVFSGHYHRHQTIGTVTYIGSPYTITFGEANDGPKGFLVVNHDGSFEQVELHLRRHYIIEATTTDTFPHGDTGENLFWYKIKGTREELKKLQLPTNAKVELIPTDEEIIQPIAINKTSEEVLDLIIDLKFVSSKEYATSLKILWKDVVECV